MTDAASMDQQQGPPPEQQQPQADSGDTGKRMNDQVRQLIMQIGQLAQAVPEAGQEFQAAAKALTAASLKIVSSQKEPSAGQPMIGA